MWGKSLHCWTILFYFIQNISKYRTNIKRWPFSAKSLTVSPSLDLNFKQQGKKMSKIIKEIEKETDTRAVFPALTWFMLMLSYSSWTALSCRILCRKAGGWWMSMGAAVWLAGSRTVSSKYSSLVERICKNYCFARWQHLHEVHKENTTNLNKEGQISFQ